MSFYTLAVVGFNNVRRGLRLDALERQIHLAWLCLNSRGSKVADGFGDKRATGEVHLVLQLEYSMDSAITLP